MHVVSGKHVSNMYRNVKKFVSFKVNRDLKFYIKLVKATSPKH